jgi:hypothetical protein
MAFASIKLGGAGPDTQEDAFVLDVQRNEVEETSRCKIHSSERFSSYGFGSEKS